MSDEFFMCCGSGHLPDQADEIARQYDACLVNYTEPNGEKRHWFVAESWGPDDARKTEAALWDELVEAGLVAPADDESEKER
jgi:hypothetical protein